jgi:3-deoxy-D-manno-octulosonate 8-phosphate phosphatase (KDO 8-P phosphatase)
MSTRWPRTRRILADHGAKVSTYDKDAIVKNPLPRRGRRDARARARRIRLLVLDVDGVLTDGRMVLTERGDELKSFHTHDGMGINLARRCGILVAFVTGEKSPIAQARGAKLGVEDVVLGARRKGEVLRELMTKHGVRPDQTAFMGDDLIDLPALERAGLAVAPADAVSEVRAVAHVVTRAGGGAGAVRECVELILRAQGRWREAVRQFVREHGGTGRA